MDKCLVIGSTVCDIVVNIDTLPRRQESGNVLHQRMGLGGCAYNVVHVLHHLDIPYTFISPIGTGIFGEFVEKHIQQVGIQSFVKSTQENGCCYCFVEKNGERTFLSHHGAEYTFEPTWLGNLNMNAYRYVYVCGLEVEDIDGERLVDTLATLPCQIIFAPSPRGKFIPKERLEKLFACRPILHMNDVEAKELASCDDVESAAKKLFSKTNQLVIVTCGEKGALYYDGKICHLVPTEKATVVNTIGAGDSHVGGFLSAMCQGYTVEEALYFANHLATKVVSVASSNLPKNMYKDSKAQLEKKPI
ncbi:bifunctional hydroxymethylpyrimidine kinase/phosphomethylpyrimidine kinase [Carnobacteriaceae bacterium zg-84]|uniref:carbohydrate kinase family protein n=1 Tax=Granulicatella sp. zg-84 TaxID=2678503 RepID=UPI0013BF9731|nr:PfkB family carbohydrate kinase [Granulicatella sp. zg-84]NEW66246.1 carbohydrate kinase family protein [Granulicatella sp. zg-84]QMI85914.1 bifunctional hydroxymethylpyrimidine kinase/phosphomethylpyrimidine kinase [Carnobacteriaceae bacterium zg-84]